MAYTIGFRAYDPTTLLLAMDFQFFHEKNLIQFDRIQQLVSF